MSTFLMKILKNKWLSTLFRVVFVSPGGLFRLSVNNKKQNTILAFGNAEHTGTEGLTVGKTKCHADAYL